MKLYDAVKSRSVGENWSGYITAKVGNKYQIKTSNGYIWAFDFEFVLAEKNDPSPNETKPSPKNLNYL